MSRFSQSNLEMSLLASYGDLRAIWLKNRKATKSCKYRGLGLKGEEKKMGKKDLPRLWRTALLRSAWNLSSSSSSERNCLNVFVPFSKQRLSDCHVHQSLIILVPYYTKWLIKNILKKTYIKLSQLQKF